MGRDKAQVEIGGRPTATRIAALLAQLCEEVLLVGGSAPPEAPGRRVEDLPGPRCGLRGLVSALAAAREQRVLVVACDLPLVSAELLLGLVAWPEAQAVVPVAAEGPQPLCAVYRRESVLGVARPRLEAGELALRGLLDALETAGIDGPRLARLDPDGTALLNVNTPDELARAQRLASSHSRNSMASSTASRTSGSE